MPRFTQNNGSEEEKQRRPRGRPRGRPRNQEHRSIEDHSRQQQQQQQHRQRVQSLPIAQPGQSPYGVAAGNNNRNHGFHQHQEAAVVVAAAAQQQQQRANVSRHLEYYNNHNNNAQARMAVQTQQRAAAGVNVNVNVNVNVAAAMNHHAYSGRFNNQLLQQQHQQQQQQHQHQRQRQRQQRASPIQRPHGLLGQPILSPQERLIHHRRRQNSLAQQQQLRVGLPTQARAQQESDIGYDADDLFVEPTPIGPGARVVKARTPVISANANANVNNNHATAAGNTNTDPGVNSNERIQNISSSNSNNSNDNEIRVSGGNTSKGDFAAASMRHRNGNRNSGGIGIPGGGGVIDRRPFDRTDPRSGPNSSSSSSTNNNNNRNTNTTNTTNTNTNDRRYGDCFSPTPLPPTPGRTEEAESLSRVSESKSKPKPSIKRTSLSFSNSNSNSTLNSTSTLNESERERGNRRWQKEQPPGNLSKSNSSKTSEQQQRKQPAEGSSPAPPVPPSDTSSNNNDNDNNKKGIVAPTSSTEEMPASQSRPTASKTLAGLSGQYRKQTQQQPQQQQQEQELPELQTSRGKLSNRRRSKQKKTAAIDPPHGQQQKRRSSQGGDNDRRSTTGGKGSRRRSGIRERSSTASAEIGSNHSNSNDDDDDNNDNDFKVEETTEGDVAEGGHRNADGSRRSCGKGNRVGRPRGRRRSSTPRKNSARHHDDDHDYDDDDGDNDRDDSDEFVPVESRLRTRVRRGAPQVQFFLMNDEEPDRITNPLLAMVPANFRKSQNNLNKKLQKNLDEDHGNGNRSRHSGSGELMTAAASAAATNNSSGGGDGKSIGKRRRQSHVRDDDSSDNAQGNWDYRSAAKVTGMIPVEEFMHSASIVFHKPDTFPISFYARLLGFDVDVPDCNTILSHSNGEQHQHQHQLSWEQEAKNFNNTKPLRLSESSSPSVTDTQSALPQFPTPIPDPQTLPLRKDTVFLKIPPEGNYFQYQQPKLGSRRNGSGKSFSIKPTLGDWDDQRVLDCIDPAYRSFLQHGWESQRCTAAKRQDSLKFIAKQNTQEPMRKQVSEMAQQMLGLSTDWTFQDWGSFQSQVQREEKEKSKVAPMSPLEKHAAGGAAAATVSSNPPDTVVKTLQESSVPASSPSQQHDRPRHHNSMSYHDYNGPMWTIDGKKVFGHLPKHIFGILASFKGEPVALLKYQFHWYKLPTSSGIENQNESEEEESEMIVLIHGIAYRTNETGNESDDVTDNAINTGENERSGEGEFISNVLTSNNSSTATSPVAVETTTTAQEKKYQIPEHQKGVMAGGMHTGNAKPQSASPVIGADADGNGIRDNGELKVHPIVPIEAQSNDVVKVIMLAMALEHTRACGVFYGLWETPESLVELNENCFRMVKLHHNESVEPSQEGTNNGNSDSINDPKSNKQRKDETLNVDASKCSSLQPMLFDLTKSSSRFAILKLKEAKDGKVIGKCNTESTVLATENGTKNGYSASSERLLVQMPPFEKAHTFFLGSSANNSSRYSKRGMDEESASSNIFTGAPDATREIALNFRAKIDAGNEEKVDIFKRDSKTGSYLEIQRRLKSTTKEPVEQIENVETKATEEEIVRGNINAHKKDNSLKDNRNNGLLPWKVLRCFPIEETVVRKIESENEILNELTRKQDELVAIEKSLEPQARALLAMTINARMEYELPESKQLLKDKEKTLTKFEEYLLKRKEIEQVRQERREEDMDAVCSICNDGEVTPDNQILFCEACNVAVHQICYGVERIPEGDYYCIACRHYERDKMIQSMSETSRLTARAKLPPLPIVCELCPSKKGAFTRLETAKSACNPCDSNTAKWVHMTCAKWHGLDFVKKGDASLVEDITELKQFYRRKNISCSICKGMRGAYTQCRHKGCTNFCHITCAIESGMCEVVHGEDVEGNLIDSNPWSILCPNHSKIDKQQKNLKGIEELVKTAKEFPVEPMPPPLLTELGPYNHLTGEQRKRALSVREYEDRYIADILKTKLSGVRCEVCDVIEDIHGRNLSRCEVCGTVVCHTCQLFCENPCQRSFKCHGCSSLSKNEDASGRQCSEPQCSMCNQKGGLLVKATSAPMLKQGYWNNNPKEFERSLFKKAQWAHILCAL
jgi:hypothetical protein